MKTRIIKNEYSSGKVDYSVECKWKTGRDIGEFIIGSILLSWTIIGPFAMYEKCFGWSIIASVDYDDWCYPTLDEAKEVIDGWLAEREKEREDKKLSKIKTIHTVIKYP